MEKILFDPTKLKLVSIDKIRPNTWNPKEKDTPEYQKVKKSIEVMGLRGFISVRDNNGYEILDGEQRYTGAKELGIKEMWVYDNGKVPDKEAMEETIWWQQQVPFAEIPLAKMVVTLVMDHPDAQLPFSESELINFKSLIDFSWNDFQDQGSVSLDDVKSKKEVTCPACGEVFKP